MFLPILFFIPNVLYYAFNEHATNSESTTITYKYQSNEVNTKNDLIEGNIYNFDIQGNVDDDETIHLSFNVVRGWFYLDFDEIDADWAFNLNNSYVFDVYLETGFKSINIFDTDLNSVYFNEVSYFEVSDDLVIQVVDVADIVLNNISNHFSLTDYNEVDDVVINTNDTISQKIYNGWQTVWSLPIFSWSSNTFFSAPFNYISGLFGFQDGNTLSNCLSYWFSISIIWLVFDVMLYVPLLVHRWLDKASIS